MEIKTHTDYRRTALGIIKNDKIEIAELRWIKPKEIEYLNLGIRNQAYLSIMRRFKLI